MKKQTKFSITTTTNTDPSPAAGFAARLAAILDAAGISVNAFAKQCGVRQSTLSNYFNPARGRPASEPTLSNLVKIARAAGVSLDWLAGGAGDEIHVRLRYYDLEKWHGYSEAFIQQGFETTFAPLDQERPESRLFDLSALTRWTLSVQNERLPIARRVETWTQKPIRAQAQLFMVRIGGSADLMAPLVRDGDLVVVSKSGATELDLAGRPVSYPCLVSHRGKVIIRLVRHERDRTTFGLIEKTSWPPKMAAANAETVLRTTVLPRVGEYFLLGRIIWCGRSLLSFDFT